MMDDLWWIIPLAFVLSLIVLTWVMFGIVLSKIVLEEWRKMEREERENEDV